MTALDPAVMRYFIRYGLVLSCVLLLTMVAANQRQFSPEMQSFFSQSVWQIITPHGSGSGCWIARKLILTNNHVVMSSDDVEVQSPRRTLKYPAKVIKKSAEHDLALLLVDSLSFIPMVLKFGNFPKRGEPVFSAGYALGKHQNYQRGISEGPAPHFDIPSDYVSNILTVPGDSGSCVLDKNMQFVGVRNAVQANQLPTHGIYNRGFSIPVYHMAIVLDSSRVKHFLGNPVTHHHDGFYAGDLP
jgi:S1-C subfamily serine protease